MSPVAIGFVVYLIIIFVVGIVTAHLNKSLPDFFLAGRRLGPWVVALAYFGGGFFDDPEKMMPHLALSIFPAWFAGILISGVLAASMSTADSQLLVTTSSVSEDIYHASLRPDAEQKHLVFVSRLVAFVIGILAIALSQLPRSIFDKVLFAWGGLGAAFGPALVLTPCGGRKPPATACWRAC